MLILSISEVRTLETRRLGFEPGSERDSNPGLLRQQTSTDAIFPVKPALGRGETQNVQMKSLFLGFSAGGAERGRGRNSAENHLKGAA